MPWSLNFFLALSLCLIVSGSSLASGPQPSEPATPAARYRAELHDLHVRRDYIPGKNSFVLGLEAYAHRPLMLRDNGRKTLLNIEGQGPGSLRHIWETHGPDPAPFELEFFVDGETEPSIRGKLPDLIRAAQRAEQPFVMNPGGFIAVNSHNFYLPVPFDESLRVDLVRTGPIRLIFTQLDYRTDEDSLEGVRLVQEGEGAEMTLRYEGPVEQATTRPATPSVQLQRRTTDFAGKGQLRLQGPGVIRRLAINATRPGARLRIFFDGAETPAVDADLADFFGPFRGTALNNNQAFFPMPFRESVVVEIGGDVGESEEFRVEADVEPVEHFDDRWRYFHARSSPPQVTNGALPFQILYTRGAGHWIGMALYESGMDHGGGDFAVVDGESDAPQFLHGINGEDYFSFAYFGRGENFPYSEAFDNDTGRFRLHLENPYPFNESLQLSFGTLQDLRPRAVSYWYQDSPADQTVGLDESKGLQWQVFGPVEAPVLEDGNTPDTSSAEKLFGPLPDPATLDEGQAVEARHLMFRETFKGVFDGWATQPAIGPHLNLTYVYGHVTDLGGHHHLGYYPRLMLARTQLQSPQAQEVTLQLSYDDPLEVVLNGRRVHLDLETHNGFITRTVPVRLQEGDNTLLVRLADTPNVTMVWAGLGLRILDDQGQEISASLQPTE